jgi:hypothetical protein
VDDRFADGHPAILDRRLLCKRGGRTGRTEQNSKGQQLADRLRMIEIETTIKSKRGLQAHLKRPFLAYDFSSIQ